MNPAIPPAMQTSAFEPTDLAFLQRFFNAACSERGVKDDSPAASNLAIQIIQLYQRGVREENELKVQLRSSTPSHN